MATLDGKPFAEQTKPVLLTEDNWRQRSEGMKCKTCMYFVPKVSSPESFGGDIPENHIGRCRRHAPTINGWPVTFQRDWCGDHKLDENKI